MSGETKHPQTVPLYTTGFQVIPAQHAGVVIVAGTGLHIKPHTKVRNFVLFDRPSCDIYAEFKPYKEMREAVYRPGLDRTERSGITDYSNQEDLNRQSVPVYAAYRNMPVTPLYTADLKDLLLLCGDVESNPGPTERDENVPDTQESDCVSS